jgi:hypothetical protein
MTLFCFTYIYTEILVQILGCSFCTGCHILGTILPNAVAIKSRKNNLQKSCSALASKMLVKLIPGSQGKCTNSAAVGVFRKAGRPLVDGDKIASLGRYGTF